MSLHNLKSVEGADWGDRSVPSRPFCGAKTTGALKDLVASALDSLKAPSD